MVEFLAGEYRETKTQWKEIKRPLRRPSGQWQVRNAARWLENLLDIPAGNVAFLKADGSRADAKETVGSLRSKAI